MELPEGFEEAPELVQYEVLRNKQSSELASEIRSLIGFGEEKERPSLTKDEKAAILLELRD